MIACMKECCLKTLLRSPLFSHAIYLLHVWQIKEVHIRFTGHITTEARCKNVNIRRTTGLIVTKSVFFRDLSNRRAASLAGYQESNAASHRTSLRFQGSKIGPMRWSSSILAARRSVIVLEFSNSARPSSNIEVQTYAEQCNRPFEGAFQILITDASLISPFTERYERCQGTIPGVIDLTGNNWSSSSYRAH